MLTHLTTQWSEIHSWYIFKGRLYEEKKQKVLILFSGDRQKFPLIESVFQFIFGLLGIPVFWFHGYFMSNQVYVLKLEAMMNTCAIGLHVVELIIAGVQAMLMLPQSKIDQVKKILGRLLKFLIFLLWKADISDQNLDWIWIVETKLISCRQAVSFASSSCLCWIVWRWRWH